MFNSAHALDRAAEAHADRLSIIYGSRRLTVAQSARITRRLAELLRDAGIEAGDRVALIARNSPYHLLVHVACARIGAIFMPISYRLSAGELADLLEFAEPRVIITDPETAEWLPDTGGERFVIDDDEYAVPSSHVWRGLYASYSAKPGVLRSILDDGTTAADACNARRYPEGPAAMLFTSGSTGSPKAVCLTHEQLWWGARNFRAGFEYSPHDIELVVAPLSHIGGLNGTTLDIFSHGGTVVVIREFDPGAVLRALETHRVQIMFGVPTMYAAMMSHPHCGGTDLSAFRLPLIGGAHVPPALLKRMEEVGLQPLNVWGMTEIAASGCYLPAEHLAQRRGSVGRPFPYTQARVVDPETGLDSAAGELWVSGPNVIHHYWRGDDFADRFTGEWLRTGDLVRRDDEGYLWVVGRLHHQINSGGEKITPEEVAAVIAQMPEVDDVAVVGVPDETWGEVVGAAIVASTDLDLAAVRQFAQVKLARYKLPKIISRVTTIPVNANGKPDVGTIRDLLSRAQ